MKRWIIPIVNVCLAVWIATNLVRLVMPRHPFRPTVTALEPRRTPSDTTGGSLVPADGVIVAELPYSDEMPTGEDAFVYDTTPFAIRYDSLIVDVDGNLLGTPAYMSGAPGPDPEPPPYR